MTTERAQAGGREPRRKRSGTRRRGEAIGAMPAAPSTATLEVVRRHLPLSIRLIGRKSWPGAVMVLAVAAVFVLVIPFAAKVELNSRQATGQTVAVGDTLELTVANDWRVISQNKRETVLASGSATLSVEPAHESPESPREILDTRIEALTSEGTSTWVVAEPTTFATSSGEAGASVTASSGTLAAQVWVITREGLTTTAVLNTTIESWNTTQAGAQQMIDSLTFTALDDAATPGDGPHSSSDTDSTDSTDSGDSIVFDDGAAP